MNSISRRSFTILASARATSRTAPRNACLMTKCGVSTIPKISSSMFASSSRRSFATDESGFHDDFKSIRKKYEAKEGESKGDIQAWIKEVS